MCGKVRDLLSSLENMKDWNIFIKKPIRLQIKASISEYSFKKRITNNTTHIRLTTDRISSRFWY